MHRVLVLGAGKIGSLLGGLLASSGDYNVDIADVNGEAANNAVAAHGLATVHAFEVDAAKPEALAAHLKAHPVDAVISGLPFFCNPGVAEVARQANIHYFDLTEDVEVTRAVMKCAQGANKAFVPQSGLAPGFISIAANSLMKHFDTVHDVKLRVGALPQNPSNMLKYSLTWSSDGLINEYGNPCYGIEHGEPAVFQPLEGLETLHIDGEELEAFNTSGGLGSLGETWQGKVQNLTYKTMRYPGHCYLMRFLMNDLDLNHDRETLKRILEKAIPRTVQDVIYIYVSVCGEQNGNVIEETYINKVFPQMINDRLWSAIQITTSAGVCAVVDEVLTNPDQYKGFVKQEQFELANVLTNRFGEAFVRDKHGRVAAEHVLTGEAAKQGI
ncbi:MAG: saccharopine dehydrogenase C-terminal domain-containing protein [Gammaproteobacteria bacterium]